MKQFFIRCLLCLVFVAVPAAFSIAQQDIQEGNATWHDTATTGLNAFHSRLPLGTRLRVTNLENNQQVYVTVTSRMPSSPNIILELSRDAARELNMADTGTTRIRFEVVRDEIAIEEPPAPAVSEPQPPESDDPWANLFADEEAAEPAETPAVEVVEIASETETVDVAEVPEPEEEFPWLAEMQGKVVPAPVTPAPPQAVPTAPVQAAPAAPPPVQAPPPPPVRTPPPQQPPVRTPVAPPPPPAPAVSAAPAPVAAGDSPMSITVIVNVNGQEHVVEVPNARAQAAAPVAARTSAPAQNPPAYSAPSSGGASTAAKIVPKMPDPRSGHVYRVQVGAFASPVFAQTCFDQLKKVGFQPAFERNGNLYRVVVTGVKAADMEQVARRLGDAGFKEAWIREEN